MRRRWIVIAVGLAAYWTLVGHAILSARRVTPSLDFHFEWQRAAVLTLSWSLLANQVGEGAPQRQVRVAYTASTTAGGVLNGLLFAAFVRWAARPPRPLSDVARDYDDGPDGTSHDGRAPLL